MKAKENLGWVINKNIIVKILSAHYAVKLLYCKKSEHTVAIYWGFW